MAVSNSGWPSLEYLGQIFSPLAPSHGQWINVRAGGWWFYPRTVHYLQVASHLCVLLFLCSVPMTLATELDRTAFVHIRLTEPPPPEGGSSPPGGSSSNNTSGESPTAATSQNNSSNNNNSNNEDNNSNNNRRDRTTQGRHRGGNYQNGHSADPRVTTPEAHREVHMKGWFAKAGNVKFAEGPLHLMQPECNDAESSIEDAKSTTELPKDWIAIMYHSKTSSNADNNDTESNCSSVIERVRRALMLGASAIILLTLQPKILRELEVSQIFFRPIVILEVVDNVTNFLSTQGCKLKAKAKIMFNESYFDLQKFTTLTLWSTCGKSSCWSYPKMNCVVCLSHMSSKQGKADPGNFWNFFYCGLLTLMMLFVIKTRRGSCDPEVDMASYQLAHEALTVIGTQKYQNPWLTGDYHQDTCAVCLDQFHRKQKLRVLPCSHAYHCKCVDPWLVKNRTCPLCKLNIVDKLGWHK